ncbi:MAG: metallophosphoesterase family protein [bacterium]|nr:MAG: metallophosphoesterase family protein [bacterium]
MKIFVCSDIHGNVRALDAVLAIYRSSAPCSFLNLGDCVGYGPHPDACLERVLALPQAHHVMGNHEWALIHRGERIHLNSFAARALDWSESLLMGKFDRSIHERFTMEYKSQHYLAAHGSPVHPEEWPYILSEIDAGEIFYSRDFHVCFIGHTHIPVIFSFEKGAVDIVEEATFRLDANDRYLINPGSVGQPRDLDPRASCCMYDTSEGTITFHRCEYDVKAEVDDFRRANLPAFLGERLLHGT